MPTITIYKDGEKVREHVAAEGGLKAVGAVRIDCCGLLIGPDEIEP